MHGIRITLICASLMTAAGIALAAASPRDPGRQILEAEAGELAAWEAKDLPAIMDFYAADAVVMPGGSVVPDRAALEALFRDFLADPGFTLSFRSDPPLVAGSGEIGVAVGTYVVTFTDARNREIVRRTGRHLMTWQRQEDGRWRIVRQMTAHDR